MATTAFNEIVRAARRLSREEQVALVNLLQVDLLDGQSEQVTREMFLRELEDLRKAGAFENVESLYGKFANPNVPELSADALHAQIHAIATEWEQELDEFDPKHN